MTFGDHLISADLCFIASVCGPLRSLCRHGVGMLCQAFHMKWSEVDWSLQDAAGDGPEGGERISQSQTSSQDYIKLSNE